MINISESLENLAYNLLKNRDISHGYIHALKVRDKALEIAKHLNIDDKVKLLKIETASLFHDLWDKKYLNSECQEQSKKIFKRNLKDLKFNNQDIKDIEIIIVNISLSNEMKLRNLGHKISLKNLQEMRDIVSDADKLEMLGQNGIDRIIQYEIFNRNNQNVENVKNEIVKVYDNKISKLLKDNYIKTDYAIKLAQPLFQETAYYVNAIRK